MQRQESRPDAKFQVVAGGGGVTERERARAQPLIARNGYNPLSSGRGRERPGARIGVACVAAFFLAVVATLLWAKLPDYHGLLTPLGLVIGALLFLPLRDRNMPEWRRAWFWRALPACGVFSAVILLGLQSSPDLQKPDTGLVGVLIALACATSLALTQMRPTESRAVDAPPSPPRRPSLDTPWPPTGWTQSQWRQWWETLLGWNRYRATVLREEVPMLAPPPIETLGTPNQEAPQSVAQWSMWHDSFQKWKQKSEETPLPFVPPVPQAEPEKPFPAGWGAPAPGDALVCVICPKNAPPAPNKRIAKHQGCGQIVCRDDLFQSGDVCPVCGR